MTGGPKNEDFAPADGAHLTNHLDLQDTQNTNARRALRRHWLTWGQS